MRICAISKTHMAWSIILWLLPLHILGAQQLTQKAAPGSIELADWSGESSRDLDGPWDFYWKQFLSPMAVAPPSDFLLGSSESWNTLKGPNGNPLEAFGFATHRLVLRGLRSHPEGYSIMFPFGHTAMHSYLIANDTGKILAEDFSGRLGQSLAEEVPSYRPMFLRIPPGFSGDLTILVHVSNHRLNGGGLLSTPLLGVADTLQERFIYASFQDFALAGATSFIGFYLFMMWYRNRRDLASLSLAFICLLAVVRTIILNPILLRDVFDDHYMSIFRLTYFTIVVGAVPGVQFIGRTFSLGRFGRACRDSYTVLCLLFSLTTLLGRSEMFSDLLVPYQLINLLSFAFIFPVTTQAIYRREEGAILCLLGILVCFAGVGFDILAANNVFNYGFFVFPSAFAIFLAFMAQIVAKKAATAYANAEAYAKDIAGLNGSLKAEIERGNELNAHLEIRVAERTSEVRALLHYIPQGILTIGKSGIVGANFSAHLPEIINEQAIAERSFKELILDRSNLSDDVKDRVWQTILGCVGDNALNFEINSGNLPTQLIFFGAEEKALKCTWNIEVDADDVIKNVLVTLLDVTSEFASNKLLDEKNKEFEVIRQLIDIEADKLKLFFASGEQLLGENQRLLSAECVGEDAIKILFINTHTLKGGARTLRLLDLAESFHHAESYYAEILRYGAPIELARLRLDQNKAQEMFDRYESINHHILGRSVNYSEIPIDREFLEHHFQVLRMLNGDSLVGASLKQIIHDNCDKIVKLIFFSLQSVLDDVMQSANRIARDLNRPEPIIANHLNYILINHKQEMALRNSFAHLLRNSLDHGIESSEVRQSKGKTPQGKINLQGEEKADKITLRYEDDGAGLNIGKLRKKGIEDKHIQADASLEDIAELIFLPGVSTASAVTIVSGRGMGMDAVRRFIHAIGGAIVIHVGPPINADLEFYSFHFLIEFPGNNSSSGILFDKQASA